MTEIKKITKHDFYFETALYDEVKISDLEEEFFEWDVDWYSSINHIDTTYSVKWVYNFRIIEDSIYHKRYVDKMIDWYNDITLNCKRKDNDEIKFYVYITDSTIIKVWQYPSLADIHFAELWKKYDKILEKEDLKNFKKAIWLNSHWAWAGSFVYLRRIFENLIFNTFNENIQKLNITIEYFNLKRMEDKVDFLKWLLPEQLVKMKKIYSILSKWVHELSEEDCLKYFPAMKLSIELILDQRIENLKKKEKDNKALETMNSILQELS